MNSALVDKLIEQLYLATADSKCRLRWEFSLNHNQTKYFCRISDSIFLRFAEMVSILVDKDEEYFSLWVNDEMILDKTGDKLFKLNSLIAFVKNFAQKEESKQEKASKSIIEILKNRIL